ncbi:MULTISPECIES: energy-coupling factor transporter transmembrane component T [Vagococcus]|uniref:Transmembrane component BL0694 of energizing module of predicted ECF transporter n=1 Tax=Vagococcus fluvialis bH819 TaxID=1255619 RepID=A0A1X6WQU5_9ENTE|nr:MULTISPECIES: energy-coupling factor transporter transmembrane component T [Vagococcus]SLM86645.1 Transmembrane component BL0694 of energizing module of predicted ECF transporter [Vagococcus fluvialis bH819]HCM90853.1 energy-coupling factor transporter transmembrane protein EcfT [Vagococcus sp.]
MKKKYVSFDPRSKLAVVLSASLLLMFRVNWLMETIFVLLMCLLLIINGGWKKGLILMSLYYLILSIDLLFFQQITGAVSAFLSFFLVANRLLLPPIMAATFAVNNTKMSEWIAAMKKMKVPKFIIVPFSVVCRFFPVLLQDFKQIRLAMKFRGIGINLIDLFKHPLLTLEYIVVPILVSVESTSIELSAAALVRGLGSAEESTSVYDVRFRIQDIILLLSLVIFFTGGWLINDYVK